MQIEWLQTFLVAAQEKNFRRTGERLHLAQPTVTQHIRRLEELWDTELFHRIGQHVELSAGGRRFIRHAQQLVQDYTESLEDMARWRQGYTTRVIVAVSPLIATSYLPRWIQEFGKIREDVEFVIQVMESVDIVDYVRNRQADVGLTRLDPAGQSVQHDILYDDEIILVAPAASQNIDAPSEDADILLEESLIFTHCHPEYWPELLTQLRRRIPDIRTMVVSQVHVAIQWVTEGLGVSFLPKSTVRREILRGNLDQVQFPFFPLPTAHTYLLQAEQINEAAVAFADYVRDYNSIRQPL